MGAPVLPRFDYENTNRLVEDGYVGMAQSEIHIWINAAAQELTKYNDAMRNGSLSVVEWGRLSDFMEELFQDAEDISAVAGNTEVFLKDHVDHARRLTATRRDDA